MQKLGILRGIQEAELPMMLAWRNAPTVRANMYTRHEIGLEEHLKWWAKCNGRNDQSYHMYEFAGSPQGIVAFSAIDPVNKNASWAFYASPDAPKGTGSRMEFLALEHAFSHLALHKLKCEVLAFNIAVIRLHEKFGFKEEGVFRQEHLVEDTFVDIYRLGILAAEWRERRDVIAEKLRAY